MSVRCDGTVRILAVDDEGVTREVNWWELLDWKTMPETFKKLPHEIRFKIAMKQGPLFPKET